MPDGDRRAEAQRRPEGDHGVADAQPLRGAERGRLAGPARRRRRGRRGRRSGCDPTTVAVVAVAVLVDDLDRAVVLGGVGDDVVVGDEVALRVERRSRSRSRRRPAPRTRDDLHGARQQLLRDRRHRAVVGGSGACETAPAPTSPPATSAVGVGRATTSARRPPRRRRRRAVPTTRASAADGRPDPARDPAACRRGAGSARRRTPASAGCPAAGSLLRPGRLLRRPDGAVAAGPGRRLGGVGGVGRGPRSWASDRTRTRRTAAVAAAWSAAPRTARRRRSTTAGCRSTSPRVLGRLAPGPRTASARARPGRSVTRPIFSQRQQAARRREPHGWIRVSGPGGTRWAARSAARCC